MKKLFTFILAFFILVSSLYGVHASTSEYMREGEYGYTLLSNGTVKILDYLGQNENVEIPSYIDGKAVTAMADGVFYNASFRHAIHSIVLPMHLKKITYGILKDCSLRKIILNDNLEKIGREAFVNSTIKEIDIPDKVTVIGRCAFLDSSLESIHLGKEVKTIGANAFDCDGLKKISVDDKNSSFCADSNVLYSKDKQKLIKYAVCKNQKKFNVPEPVKEIAPFAFSHSRLKRVSFPKSLNKIGEKAFINSQEIVAVHIPKSVTFVGDNAFQGCKRISKISFDENKKLKFGSGVFNWCSGLKTVTMPILFKSGGWTFNPCKNIKKISISSKVKTIFEGDFSSCSITSLTIPKNIEKIEKQAFSGCLKLKLVTVKSKNVRIGKEAFGYKYDEYELSHKIKNFVIKGYKNSTAEKYAKKNGFRFKTIK